MGFVNNNALLPKVNNATKVHFYFGIPKKSVPLQGILICNKINHNLL